MDTLIGYIDPLMYKISEYGIYGNIVSGIIATFIVFTLFNGLKCKRHSVSVHSPFLCFIVRVEKRRETVIRRRIEQKHSTKL
jgi:hypothetical protein